MPIVLSSDSHILPLPSPRPMMRYSLSLAYLRPVLGSFFYARFVGSA